MTSLTGSWQRMREKTSPERFFHVSEACMAEKPPCASSSLCSAALGGRLGTATGWGQCHKPGDSSLQACSSLCLCPRGGECRAWRLDPSPGPCRGCHTSCSCSAGVSWGVRHAVSLGDP